METAKKIDDLFKPRTARGCTLTVQLDTYEIVTKVARETGRSRPAVLEVFVAEAYELYRRKKDATAPRAAVRGVAAAPKAGDNGGAK